MGGLVHAAGVPMGNRLLMKSGIPEHLRPKYDYFEDKDIVQLQDDTLLLLKRHWSSFRASYPIKSEDSLIRINFKEKLSDIINQRLRGKNLWAVKDPRIAVLIGEWIELLLENKIDIKLLIVHRDPLSNINSFSQKGQVPMLWSEALWQRTYINAFKAYDFLSKDQVYFAKFEDLIRNSYEEVRKICEFLNWDISKDLEGRIKHQIDTSLPTKNLNKKPYNLQSKTKEIEKMLIEKSWNKIVHEESEMISNQIKDALNIEEPKLGLNSIYNNEQTLMPKVKVIIVTSELQNFCPCGGIGSAYYELAKALKESGHQVSIFLVNQTKYNYLLSGIEVVQVNPEGISRLALAREIALKIKELKADVIHVHDWLGLSSGLKSSFDGEVPKIFVGMHGPTAWTRTGNPWPKDINGNIKISERHLYEEGLIRSLEEDAILNSDLLICPSQYMMDWLKNNIVNNEIDITIQRNCSLSDRLISNKLICSTNNNQLIYFGRLEERKGLKLFLEALEKLKSKPDNILFIGGDCYLDEDLLASKYAESKLNQLNITCEFESNLNRKEALKLIHHRKYIVVIPSIIENSPCVIEELLDSGVRVVTTDVGGTKEMVLESDIKWLSKASSYEIAKHLDKALSLNDQNTYLLRARIPSWKIKLSWQAFHERIPLRQKDEKIPEKQMHINKLQRISNFIKRSIKKLTVFNKPIFGIK